MIKLSTESLADSFLGSFNPPIGSFSIENSLPPDLKVSNQQSTIPMTKEHLYYCTFEIIKLIKYFIQHPHPSKSFYESGLKKIGTVLQTTLSNLQTIYYQYNLKPLLTYHLT